MYFIYVQLLLPKFRDQEVKKRFDTLKLRDVLDTNSSSNDRIAQFKEKIIEDLKENLSRTRTGLNEAVKMKNNISKFKSEILNDLAV